VRVTHDSLSYPINIIIPTKRAAVNKDSRENKKTGELILTCGYVNSSNCDFDCH
jgi:hypothetical protein